MRPERRREAIDALRAAVRGRLPREAARPAVFRLLAESDEPLELSAPELDASQWSEAFDTALEGLPVRLLARDAALGTAHRVAGRLDDVCRVSPAEARARAVALDEADRPAVITELVRRVDEAALDEPAHAIALAGVAVAAAEAARSRADEPRDFDLRAEARRALSEAAFRVGDLVAADGAVAEAKRLARQGSLDAVLRAELLRLESEIRMDQSRFEEARRLASRAVRLFARTGETRREARARISLALKLAYEGRLEAALAESARGLALVDAERDGRWICVAEFNRAFWRNDAGDSAGARAELPRLADLVARFGRELDRVRLVWLEARIAAQEGDLEAAVELYRRVLSRCLDLDTLYDSATVALELAVVLLELGRPHEVVPLADTVAPIFRAQGVEPEAAAAVILAAESLRRGVAAREVLRTLLAARAGTRAGR